MKKLVVVIGAVFCLTAWNIKASPNVYAWGPNSAVPSDLTNAVQVSVGWGQFLALRDDGTITGWGTNSYGEGSDPFGLTNVVQVSAGPRVSAATLADGTIAVWGQIDPAVVFPTDLTNVVKIVACETNEFFVLRDTGEADAFGVFTNLVLYGVGDIDGKKYNVATGDSCLMAVFTNTMWTPIWISDIVRTPKKGNYIPAAVSNIVEVATAGTVYRAAIRDDGWTFVWDISNTNASSMKLASSPSGTNGPLVEICGGGASGMYCLRTNGTVITVTGAPWPTNSPALQVISAGNLSGAGIITP